MIQTLRSKKGFTLMEMLIVVAIIAILAAIAIPVFSAQLNKAKEGTDRANQRTAESLAVADYMLNNRSGKATYTFGESKDGIGIMGIDCTPAAATTDYDSSLDALAPNATENLGKTLTVVIENVKITDSSWESASGSGSSTTPTGSGS